MIHKHCLLFLFSLLPLSYGYHIYSFWVSQKVLLRPLLLIRLDFFLLFQDEILSSFPLNISLCIFNGCLFLEYFHLQLLLSLFNGSIFPLYNNDVFIFLHFFWKFRSFTRLVNLIRHQIGPCYLQYVEYWEHSSFPTFYTSEVRRAINIHLPPVCFHLLGLIKLMPLY